MSEDIIKDIIKELQSKKPKYELMDYVKILKKNYSDPNYDPIYNIFNKPGVNNLSYDHELQQMNLKKIQKNNSKINKIDKIDNWLTNLNTIYNNFHKFILKIHRYLLNNIDKKVKNATLQKYFKRIEYYETYTQLQNDLTIINDIFKIMCIQLNMFNSIEQNKNEIEINKHILIKKFDEDIITTAVCKIIKDYPTMKTLFTHYIGEFDVLGKCYYGNQAKLNSREARWLTNSKSVENASPHFSKVASNLSSSLSKSVESV
jgi:hypothetical protein